MWIAARERGIQVKQLKVFGNFLNVFLADYKGKPFIFEALPRPLGSRRLDWIDDKAHIKKLFRENGIPVAKGGSYFSYQKALETFKSLRKPVIIKPTFGSRSRHTTIHIETETEFARAFKIAKEISPLVIVEEELQGPVWRVSLIGGKVAGVLRRDPPIVVGDGTKTIEELIALENKNPKRGKVFHEIPLDTFVEKELLYKGLTLTSIPAKGEKIILHPKVGRSQGGTNSHVDNIHRDNIELFEKMARVVGDPLIGVDFITSHMGKSWKEQELCGAIECNSVPFLDLHHVPYEGEPVDTMGKLWDVVLLSL